MNADDIRALADAVERGIDDVLALTTRASSGCPDADVIKELQDIRNGLVDIMQDSILGGLRHIAEKRAEQDTRDAELTRGCEAYHRRRDYEMEGLTDA